MELAEYMQVSTPGLKNLRVIESRTCAPVRCSGLEPMSVAVPFAGATNKSLGMMLVVGLAMTVPSIEQTVV